LHTNGLATPELPHGWTWARLGDVARYINGRAFKPSDWETTGKPIIRIQNLTSSTDRINRYSKEVDEKYLIQSGDLLISWSATLGAYIYIGEEAVLNQHIFKVESFIDKLYLFYLVTAYLQSLKSKVHGTGMQHITKGKFDESVIPLPPLAEQPRIVQKIEEILTQLDAGVAALEKVKVQLRHYRQAVLKAAFEGSLTQEWRAHNKDLLETAEFLSEKVCERKKTWNGKKTRDNGTGESQRISGAPGDWSWTRIKDIAPVIQYGSSEKAEIDPSGIPIIRMGNLQDGKIDYSNLKYLSRKTPDVQKFFLECGDVLFNRTNSPELVGKTAVFNRRSYQSVFASYLIRVRVDETLYSPEFLSYYINSIFGRAYISSVVSQQVGQANVNGTKLANMPIPYPSFNEQAMIVSEIERLFSIIVV
jgi:type I restriction enzyme S subunit